MTPSWLEGLLARALRQALTEPEDEPPAAPPDAGEQMSKAMADVRQLLNRTGTAFAAAGAVIVGGLGYARLHELFPAPEGDVWWVALLALVAALMAFLGAAAFAARFFRAQRRILLSANPEHCEKMKGDELSARERVYEKHAEEELARTLYDVELRAYRLKRMARALPAADPRVAAWQAEANRLLGEVQLGIGRAALRILARRSRDAFRGKWTAVWLVTSIVGIVLLFGVVDYSEGQRDRVDLLAKCQAAINDGATDACDGVRNDDASEAVEEAGVDRQRAAAAALQKLRNRLPKSAVATARRIGLCARVLAGTKPFDKGGDEVTAALAAICGELSRPPASAASP